MVPCSCCNFSIMYLSFRYISNGTGEYFGPDIMLDSAFGRAHTGPAAVSEVREKVVQD